MKRRMGGSSWVSSNLTARSLGPAAAGEVPGTRRGGGAVRRSTVTATSTRTCDGKRLRLVLDGPAADLPEALEQLAGSARRRRRRRPGSAPRAPRAAAPRGCRRGGPAARRARPRPARTRTPPGARSRPTARTSRAAAPRLRRRERRPRAPSGAGVADGAEPAPPTRPRASGGGAAAVAVERRGRRGRRRGAPGGVPRRRRLGRLGLLLDSRRRGRRAHRVAASLVDGLLLALRLRGDLRLRRRCRACVAPVLRAAAPPSLSAGELGAGAAGVRTASPQPARGLAASLPARPPPALSARTPRPSARDPAPIALVGRRDGRRGRRGRWRQSRRRAARESPPARRCWTSGARWYT